MGGLTGSLGSAASINSPSGRPRPQGIIPSSLDSASSGGGVYVMGSGSPSAAGVVRGQADRDNYVRSSSSHTGAGGGGLASDDVGIGLVGYEGREAQDAVLR